MSTLLQLDQLWLHWIRNFAKALGAYNERRLVQFIVVLVFTYFVLRHWRLRSPVFSSGRPPKLILIGVYSTLFFHLLGYISFHYTDLVLDSIWLGLTIGRWLELLSFSLVITGVGIKLLQRGRSPQAPSSTDSTDHRTHT